MSFPVSYIEPVFRPPSEANSLILPVTNGCSWNQCTFCEMYTQPQKKFRARDEAQVLEEIRRCGEQLIVQRVFLADGDALVLPTHRVLTILRAIAEHLPEVTRVSSYCLPRNLRRKSVEELKELADAGLGMVYVGAESGDDEVLDRVNKGETAASTRDALLKLGEAGIARSVMVLNGLGGTGLSDQHADRSAQLMNETQPEFLSTLVVSFPMGMTACGRVSRISVLWTRSACSAKSSGCWRGWSCTTRSSAVTMRPTTWSSRGSWERTSRACWSRCARPSQCLGAPIFARNGSAGCDGAEPAFHTASAGFTSLDGGTLCIG